MLDSYIAIVTHPMLILFLTMCAVAYLFLALISLPKDGERHWADLKLPFFDKLGLSDLPTPILLLGSVIWAMLFAVFGFGLFWVVWKLFVHEPPNNVAGAADLRWYLLTLTAMTASLSAVIAVPFTLLRLQMTGRQTDATEQGLITDRINKAVEGLGAEKAVKTLFETPKYRVDENKNWRRDKNDDPTPALRPDGQSIVDRQTLETTEPNLEVRIGAILSLERISQDSERDHIQIMEILCAYIRENVAADAPDLPTEDLTPGEWRKWGDENRRQPRLDIDIALKVIERRSPERKAKEAKQVPPYRLGLEYCPLWALDLSGRNLSGADLTGAKLQGTNLAGVILQSSILNNANLLGVDLTGVAKLQGADFTRAKLQGVDMDAAQLQGAKLILTKAQGAKLTFAGMQGALLKGTKLQSASLGKAKLQGADLSHAKLIGAILEWSEFDQDTSFGGTDFYGAFLQNISFPMSASPSIETAFGDPSVKLSANCVRPKHWKTEITGGLYAEWRAWQRDVLRMNPDGTDMDADPDAP